MLSVSVWGNNQLKRNSDETHQLSRRERSSPEFRPRGRTCTLAMAVAGGWLVGLEMSAVCHRTETFMRICKYLKIPLMQQTTS